MRQINAIPVSEWGDDKSRGVPQVLVRVAELSVTNVGIAVLVVVVPPVSELRQPGEGLRAVHLGGNQFAHHVTSMHINGTDGHDLLSISRGQLTQQQSNQVVQLLHLLFVVVFQSIFVPFLQPSKGNVDLCCPPNLCATESHLGREVKQPLVPGFFLICGHSFCHLMSHRAPHGIQQIVEPMLYLSSQVTCLVQFHHLSIFTVHGSRNLGVITLVVLCELQLSHTVKQFGQMTGHLKINIINLISDMYIDMEINSMHHVMSFTYCCGVVAIGQDVQQISR